MMKRICLFLTVFLLSYPAFSQLTIQMRNIWTRPQVHVLFEGYTISFTIKDIDQALLLLTETGDSSFGRTSGLDTAKDYFCELYSGTRMEVHTSLQALLQNGVGAFLLSAGHAYIENSRHKPVRAVIMDAEPFPGGVNNAYVRFSDPHNDKRVFTGKMAADMYNKDLGID